MKRVNLKPDSISRKKAALYDPYLDTLGGGEKHILSILKVLDEYNYLLTIFWDQNLTGKINERFNLKFKNLFFASNIFKKNISFIKKQKILKDFDILLYVTDGSYFFSSSKNNYIFVMVPEKKLFNLNFITKLKLSGWKFITNSKFTQSFLKDWEIKSEVIYPYLDVNFVNTKNEGKEKIILSVGRFFTHLHAKKHDLIIELFKKNKDRFPGYKLVLAGGLNKENLDYFNKLKKLAGDDRDIEFRTNISYSKLLDLYRKSMFYWHFAGFGIDERKYPQLVEHFGITPLEAMALGSIPFVYNAGGPKEIIREGKNGFLFNSEKELIEKTLNVIGDLDLQNKIRNYSKKFIGEEFCYKIFKKRTEEILL